MNYPKYDLKTSTDSTIFEFISNGPKGNIIKIIKFTAMKNPEVFNLGFGDKININETNKAFDIDDIHITDNGDRNIILATVVDAIYSFTKLHPDKYIYFSGSSAARTRLYRMVVSANYDELLKTFHIFGIVQNPDTKNYYHVPFNNQNGFVGFLIKRK